MVHGYKNNNIIVFCISLSSLKSFFFFHLQGEIKCLQRATRKDFLFNGSFQEATGSIIAMAQCFAIMPVVGVKSKSASKLQFKWISIRTIYSFITFVFVLITTGMTMWITLSHEIKFSRMSEIRSFTLSLSLC